MNVLDLFSGIGGFSLGLQRAGMKTIGFCEIDKYCQKVLKKNFPDIPIYDDVCKLTGSDINEPVDLICGGFPCQPFSVAGKRLGAADDRHLWPEYLRLIQELRPTWVIGENVAGLINMGLDNVLSNLEGAGYSSRTFVIPAVAVDAKHRRDRIWVVAHSMCSSGGSEPREQQGERAEIIDRSCARDVAHTGFEGVCQRGIVNDACEDDRLPRGIRPDGVSVRGFEEGKDMADSASIRQSGPWQSEQWGSSTTHGEGQANILESIGVACEWGPEPAVGRVAHGIPHRMDRLKGLGNAVVPQIPEIIGNAIMEVSRS
jgi:DNA (cytosine-5)-methyltransferase 1